MHIRNNYWFCRVWCWMMLISVVAFASAVAAQSGRPDAQEAAPSQIETATESSSQNTAQASATDVATPTESDNKAVIATDEKPAPRNSDSTNAEQTTESEKTFNPTEEIVEDQAVSFPVDI